MYGDYRTNKGHDGNFKSCVCTAQNLSSRFGWLKKGLDQAAQDPDVFLQEDATIQLGVGKNMVRAIRYWCSAFKLIEDKTNDETKKREIVPTGLRTKSPL